MMVISAFPETVKITLIVFSLRSEDYLTLPYLTLPLLRCFSYS